MTSSNPSELKDYADSIYLPLSWLCSLYYEVPETKERLSKEDSFFCYTCQKEVSEDWVKHLRGHLYR